MNTLTAIEAERVVQILRFASDRLTILSYVPPLYDEDISAEIQKVCEPISVCLEKLWQLEENFLALTDGMGPNDLGAAEIALLKQMHKTTRTLCRNFSIDITTPQRNFNIDRAPAPLQILMGRPELKSDVFSKFIRYLNELKNNIQVRLTTTVEDEASNRHMLHDLTERERHAEESKEALQTKLHEVREEKDRVTFELDQILRKLQIELQVIFVIL